MDNNEVVYRKQGFIIIRVDNGFIVINTTKEFKEGHTHIKSLEVGKTLIDCALHNKMPKTRNLYLLQSLIRISSNEKQIKDLESLIEVRKNKSNMSYVIKR